jgi:hypothetical protein
MSLREFFDRFDESCEPVGTASFQWTAKGVGFGGMYFYFDKKDSYVHCENEIMSRKFLKEMLCHMVDNCVLDCPNEQHADTGINGLPPNYNPVPYVEPEPIVRRVKRDKDSTQENNSKPVID